MRIVVRTVVALLLVLGFALPALAQFEPLTARFEIEDHENGRVTMDLVDADVRAVLAWLAEHTTANIVLDETVEGTVTVRVVDVPLDDALQAVIWAAGLVAIPTPSGAAVCVGTPESDCAR